MRKVFYIVIIVLVLTAAYGTLVKFNVLRQSITEKKVKIGIVVRGESYRPAVDGFKQKMKELGFAEGRNVTYVIKFVDKKEDIPPAVADMVKQQVDLLHTYSTPVSTEAYKQTKNIPIVIGSFGDPLATAFVESLQHPGKNVTGVTSLSVPLVGKRLEYLKEAFPNIHKVAFAFAADDLTGKNSYDAVQETAKRLKVEIVPYYITKDRDVNATALAIHRGDVDGMVLSADSQTWAALGLFIAQSKKEKLPFAVFDKDMVAQGGLIGYGPDYFVMGQQSAALVAKIVHGAKPADLPIESPRKLIIGINLKTAEESGFTIPDELLAKADLVVK